MFNKSSAICYLIMCIFWWVISIFSLDAINEYAKFLKVAIQSYAVGVLLYVSMCYLIKGEVK